MGAGISGNYGESNGSSHSTTNYNNTGTYTPNNLAALQAGWGAAGGLLGTNWQSLITGGMNATAGAVPGATGLNSTGAAAATNFANGNYVDNPANAFLTPYANGSKVGTDNPEFQGVMSHIANGVQAATDGNYAASGRYGSGANANAFNSAVTQAGANLGYQNYNDQQNRQISAADLIAGNYNTGRGQQLSAAGLTPSLVSSMFTPGSALSTQGYGPLAAYIAAITAGNGGGTQNNQGTQTTDGTTHGNQWGVNAQVSGGTGMSGGMG